MAGTPAVAPSWCPGPARRVAVIRTCYLGLRRLRTAGGPGDRVVLIEEPGRALTRRDVVAALGSVDVTLRADPAVARSVDAGLLATRLPRSLRGLQALVPAPVGALR
ncbi:MAG: hypothetical protein R2695_17080 [Acidimicrobiales bacterium]